MTQPGTQPARQPGSGLAARAAAWRDADPDPQTRGELDRLLARGDTAALAERFEGSLAFGTAGIRAEVGAGPLRMNRLVAGRVAAGLARFITTKDPAAAGAGGVGGVAIGYDGRTNSAVFAADAARILSRAGIRVALLPAALPTPVLAFTVRHERAAYGLMVTASHNPRQYNGIKVYVRDGGQLLPPVDEEIAAAIDAVDPLRLPAGWAEGPFEFDPADEAVRAYVAAVAAGGRSTSATPRPTATGPATTGPATTGQATTGPGARQLKVVHTALHGVGDATFRDVLAAAGWPAAIPVAAQQQPDPGFPTVPYPNPEEPGVLDLARETAERAGADLVLANDPDADRLAVMVPGPAGWQMLTGDELGALLGDAVLTRLASEAAADGAGEAQAGERQADGPQADGPQADGPQADGRRADGRRAVVATTVVSGSLLRRLADAAGVRCVTTLTGFKWIARAGGDSTNGEGVDAEGADAEGGDLVYGYEQALGYAVRPDLVADKDGISAALLVLQLATAEAQRGRTLLDRLDDLALAHGLHVTRQHSLRADGPAGLARLADAVERVRKEPPRLLAGQPVTVTDLLEGDPRTGDPDTGDPDTANPGTVDLAGGHAERAPGRPVPPADVLIWHVGATASGAGARVMIRPSGTEPELKIYAEVVRPVPSRSVLADARASAAGQVEQLLAAAAAVLRPSVGGDLS